MAMPAFGNDRAGVCEPGRIDRHMQDRAQRSIVVGKQVDAVVRPERHARDFVGEQRNLAPRPIRPQQIVRKLAAVAVRHRGQNVTAIIRRLQPNLGDAREVFAERVSVLRGGCAETVKIDLLDRNPDRPPAAPSPRG